MSTLMPTCTGGLEARIVTALTMHKEGAAVIIGANTGSTFTDPSFAALNSSTCAHLDKVFVEPIPSLFHALTRNIRQMPGARAVQAAVTDDETARTLPMYCLFDPTGDDVEKPTALTGTSIPQRRQKAWWNQVCTLDATRLIGASAHDLRRDLGVSGAVELSTIVRNVSVPALTVERLLAEHVHRPVRYVQIDVEGADDRVVRMLPLGQTWKHGTFSPTLITFEWTLIGRERLTRAVERLAAANYRLCREGQNVVATKAVRNPAQGSHR